MRAQPPRVRAQSALGVTTTPRLAPQQGSVLDEGREAAERVVPLLRDLLQMAACLIEAPGLETPDALPTWRDSRTSPASCITFVIA